MKRLHHRGAARRRFLGAAAAATGLAAGLPAAAAAPSPAVFRFQGAWAATDLFHEYALDYAKQVNDMSGGRVRIEVLPAGAVVKPEEMLDAVEKGVLDGCHAAPVYWTRKDLSFSLFGSGPALGLDANLLLSWMEHGGGRALYEALQSSVLYHNVTGFLYGPLPAQPLGWFRRPLESPAQFKGLRCHARGLPARMFREMGAIVQDLPEEEILPAARRGSLDAVAFNHAAPGRQPGLPEVLPVCMLQSYHQPARVFEVLYSRKRLDALAPDLRAIVEGAAQAASAGLSWKAAHRCAADYLAWRDIPGVRFLRTPAAVLRAQLQAWSAVAKRAYRDNPSFGRIFDSQQAWARRTVGWSLDTIVDPRMAFDYWFARATGGGPGKP